MRLQLSTWPDIEAYLSRSQGIVVPMGSTEQHGPHGLIGTDAITSESIAWAMQAHCDVLIGPTLSLGPAAFNLDFPGTVCVRPSTWMALVMDCIQSLSHQGFRAFYFLNGHGGNMAPTLSAIQEVQWMRSLANPAAPALFFQVRSWWDLSPVNKMRQAWYGPGEGMHATPSEISITRFTHPEHCPVDALAPAPALSAHYLRTHAGDQHADAHHHRARFPDGRVGSDSGLSNPAHGKDLLEAAALAASQEYMALLNELKA
jgi:creatinine amidohydrolase